MARPKKSSKSTRKSSISTPITAPTPTPDLPPVLDAYERETVINMNESDSTATVYTYKKKYKERLVEIFLQYPDQFKLLAPKVPDTITNTKAFLDAIVEDPQRSMTFELPWKFISIHSPREPKQLSEEDKEILRERMVKARAAKEEKKKK